MKRISLLLAAVLLLSLLTGCGDSGVPRESTVGTTAPVPTAPLPTLPPETTAPTTLPPESEPTETGMPFPHRDPAGNQQKALEEKFGLEFYSSPSMYTLRKPGQEFDFQDDSGVKLTIPESWKDRVVVFETASGYPNPEPRIGTISVVGKPLMEAYWENGMLASDYTIALTYATKTAYYADDGNLATVYRTYVEEGKAAVVAENDTFVYIVYTDQSLPSSRWVPGGEYRDDLISIITEVGYQEAVGDITCTLEEAVAMCSVDEN